MTDTLEIIEAEDAYVFDDFLSDQSLVVEPDRIEAFINTSVWTSGRAMASYMDQLRTALENRYPDAHVRVYRSIAIDDVSLRFPVYSNYTDDDHRFAMDEVYSIMEQQRELCEDV